MTRAASDLPSSATARPRGRPATLLSFLFTALATLTPPSAVIGGLLAIALAVVGWRRGDELARPALGVAVVVLAFGLVTGGLLVLVDELGIWDTGWGG